MTGHIRQLAPFLLVAISAGILSGCAICGSCSSGSGGRLYGTHRVEQIAGFDIAVFSNRSTQSGRSILILHELSGPTARCLSLAEELSARGTVYVPRLFGSFGESRGYGGAFRYFLGNEWCDWGRRMPVLSRIDRLVQEINSLEPDNRLAVVGMCLCGSLPVAMASHANVDAIVCAQPAIPVFHGLGGKHSCGLGTGDLKTAMRRAEDGSLHAFLLRFKTDRLSPPERFRALVDNLPGCVAWEITNETYAIDGIELPLRLHPHSTLTGEWQPYLPADHPSCQARSAVDAFIGNPAGFAAANRGRAPDSLGSPPSWRRAP